MINTITVETKKIILTSERRAFKTEGFVSATRKTVAADAFIGCVAGGIFENRLNFKKGCYSAQTEDDNYLVCFACGYGDGRVCGDDLIFYKYVCATSEGGTDRRLQDYLTSNSKINLSLRDAGDEINGDDATRLYLVSCADGAISFPFLNEVQRKIVETEDANMLVQGVAGSGKTNVCVEKVVYCACRNYRGRVLYTTFSRGLLSETRNRVELFSKSIENFVAAYAGGNAVFLGADYKKAVENTLGIPFIDGEIIPTLKRIAEFLKTKVDYFLIEDIYNDILKPRSPQRAAGEGVFLKEYLGGRNYRLSGAVDRIKNLSPEIIYKEIYGMIFGKYSPDCPRDMLEREQYFTERAESFTRKECDLIYSVAVDYAEFLKRRSYTDNNLLSRELLQNIGEPVYSVGVIDEAQDFTQVNLYLMKKLCRKLFCVGDALQMINPSYFNFGYLKGLTYGDVSGICELKHNYRSTQKIEQIAERLGDMNVRRFGTHSFVLRGEKVPSPLPSAAVFVKDRSFAYSLGDKKFENITIVVASQTKKEKLKKALGKIEILTVAEAKGLERGTVILIDVLSDNADKWRYLQDTSLNRKTADENSVYRYYFNLFYVAISRARQYLFVAESDCPKFFEPLFDECFEQKSKDSALAFLTEIAGKTELDDEELCERIQRFCLLEQYENAKNTADKLSSDEERKEKLAYIEIHEKYLRYGKHREAGVEYWKRGFDGKAREQFRLSGDEKLFPLMDACLQGGGALDPEIVRFFPVVGDNEAAKSIILDTLKSDCEQIEKSFKAANVKSRRKRQ